MRFRIVPFAQDPPFIDANRMCTTCSNTLLNDQLDGVDLSVSVLHFNEQPLEHTR